MNQKELLEFGKKILSEYKIEDSYIKAKKILEYVLNQTSSEFIMNSLEEVSKNNELEYKTKLQEIINEKPLQYITHKQEFMGLEFYVDENVLIPQPDTEILVETAIKIIEKRNLKNKEIIKNYDTEKAKENKQVQVLDLCTGSGCIGISIAKYVANTKVIVADISKEAIQIAKKNAILNNVEERIEFIVSNLFENIGQKQFDYIVSNPPYIETDAIKTLSKEVQNEPKLALDGGEDGLKFYKEILKNAYKYLLPNGYLILEIGYNQAEKIINIYKENFENKLKSNKSSENLVLETKSAIKDLGGNDRVLIFKK